MNVDQIETEVARLTKRVKRLHNGDWVGVGYHTGGWYARCPLGSVLPGSGETPQEAMNEFERNLRIAEARQDAA